MSFFYGLGDSNFNNGSSGTTDGDFSGFNSMWNKTVLPGHNFKDPYATATIAVDIASIIALVVLLVILFINPSPDLPRHLKGDKDATAVWEGTWKPISRAKTSSFGFILYLAFDIGVRWCIERRMTVPYAFSAVDIPSKVILMFTELILLWAVSRPLQCVCIRLKIVGGWYGIYEVVLIPAFIVLAVLLAGERVASGYKMYRYAFMWNRPDPKWYAACLLAWVCALLWCSLVNLVAAIAAFSSYRSKRERIGFDRNLEPCGKLPVLVAFIITPAYFIRALSKFGFVFYFRWFGHPQNPRLELPRMSLEVVPVVAIIATMAYIKRDDFKLKTQWEQPQPLIVQTQPPFYPRSYSDVKKPHYNVNVQEYPQPYDNSYPGYDMRTPFLNQSTGFHPSQQRQCQCGQRGCPG